MEYAGRLADGSDVPSSKRTVRHEFKVHLGENRVREWRPDNVTLNVWLRSGCYVQGSVIRSQPWEIRVAPTTDDQSQSSAS